MKHLKELLGRVQKTEKEICNFSLVFAEIFKNEINASDDHELYIRLMEVIRKYADDEKIFSALNEFFNAIAEGATLEEVMEIAIEEAGDPSALSELTVDDSCKLKQQ